MSPVHKQYGALETPCAYAHLQQHMRTYSSSVQQIISVIMDEHALDTFLGLGDAVTASRRYDDVARTHRKKIMNLIDPRSPWRIFRSDPASVYTRQR